MAHQDARKREVRAVRKESAVHRNSGRRARKAVPAQRKDKVCWQTMKRAQESSPASSRGKQPCAEELGRLTDEEELDRSSQPNAERHGK